MVRTAGRYLRRTHVRSMHCTRPVVSAYAAWHQMEPICMEWLCTEANEATQLTAIIQSHRLTLFGHIMRMDDNADSKRILLASPTADWRRQLGVPASRGLAPSNRIWNNTTLRSPKQQIWLRTALCWGWCRRMALRNRELHARNDASVRQANVIFQWQCLYSLQNDVLLNCLLRHSNAAVVIWKIQRLLEKCLSHRQLVNIVSATCFYHLRQLRRIRRSLDADSAATLVHAFMTSRVDYCNAILAAAPKTITDRLQRVLNAAARVVSDTKKFDQGLSRLMHQELHWLDIPEPSKLQAGSADPPVSARQGASVPIKLLHSSQHLRSAARHQLAVPRHRLSTYGRRAFAVASPTMFNTLPDDLRDPAVSTSTFIQSSKTHFFLCLSARLAH